MEVFVNERPKPLLVATHIKQRRTIFGRWKDGIEDTFKLFINKDFSKAQIEKIDTTDYGLSSYSLIQRDYDETYLFDFADKADIEKFLSWVKQHFKLIGNTVGEIYKAAEESDNLCFRHK